jgi:hypothetical protein
MGKIQEPDPGSQPMFRACPTPEHYPFWSQGRLNTVTRVDILARSTQEPPPGSIDVADKSGQNDPAAKKDSLVKDLHLAVCSLDSWPTSVCLKSLTRN